MKAPKRAYRVLALAATAAIFLSGCGGANDKPAANPSEDAVLTLASGVEPQSLDPAMSPFPCPDVLDVLFDLGQ